MTRRKTFALAVTALVLLALGAVAVFWSTRSDPPPALSVDAVAADPTTSEQPDDLAGRWEVVPDPDTMAGLRIDEARLAGLGDHTAVGRTSAVTGSLTVVSSQVTDGSFAVDLSSLEFTDDPGIPVAGRSDYLRTRALETDSFPTASFELTSPIDLTGTDLAVTTSFTVDGELSLHGVTRERSFDVDVRSTASGMVMGTTAPVEVVLADHDIEAPRLAGVSEVADVGQFEFVVVLDRR